ncbi:MAG: ABC transporter ATP-binding protein [Phycisphaerales bacterium]|nr:ABC transporter ATP-binding protein [Phycisphaerales bacterium]
MVRTGEKNGEHQAYAKPDSKGVPTEITQTLEEALTAAEAILDGSPPNEAGPRGVASFRAWIEGASQAQDWPDPSHWIQNDYWRETKAHVSNLIQTLRSDPSALSREANTPSRLNDALKSYLTFGAIYSLIYLEPSDSDSEQRELKYDLSNTQRVDALEAVVNGWVIPGSQEQVPGIAWLLLNEPTYAQFGFTSLKFYFTHIDYYLETLRLGSNARKPAILRRRFQMEPSILADDVWVRFMIRYHKREVTIRESMLSLLSPSRDAKEGSARARKEFWALRGIKFEAHPGDVVGIVGRNGSGKTTLLKALSGILGADRGRIVVRGKVGCLLSFGVGFNNNLSGKENVYLNGSILGLSEEEIDKRLDRIVEFSELGDFINAPVRTYSAGMRGRLGFSIAVHIDPDVLILDEVLSVGDAYFRDKAGSIVDRFASENKTVVIASHSMNLIRELCTAAIWIESGQIRMQGSPDQVTRAYIQFSRERADRQRSKPCAELQES